MNNLVRMPNEWAKPYVPPTRPEEGSWEWFISLPLERKYDLIAEIRIDCAKKFPTSVFAYKVDRSGKRVGFGIFLHQLNVTCGHRARASKEELTLLGKVHWFRDWDAPGYATEQLHAGWQFIAWGEVLKSHILRRPVHPMDYLNRNF
jgi:hypothetical protein